MANRPKSTALKLAGGNPGKRPINLHEPKPKKGIPRMPIWLKTFPVAVKEWKREAKELNDMGIMTTAECGNLSMRVYIACQIQELAVDIKDEGRVITLTRLNKEGEECSTSARANPKCIQLKNLVTEYRQLGSILGLDAPSRTKLKADKPKRKSKAESFRTRKNAVQR